MERAVTQAWDAVGVTTTGSMAAISATMGAETLLDYIVTMPAAGRYRAVLNWNDPDADLDLLLSRLNCVSLSCMLTVANSATQRPETICWDVQAGEQYRLWVLNYSSRPQSFRIEQAISAAPGNCPSPGSTATAADGEKRRASPLIR